MTQKSIEILPFEEKYLEETLSFLKEWSPEHPELSHRELFHWQKYNRYLAFFKGEIYAHVAQIEHEFSYGKEKFNVGWGATFVINDSNPLVRVFAGTKLLDKVLNNANNNFAAIGVIPSFQKTLQRLNFRIDRDSINFYARFFNPDKALKYLNRSALFTIPIKAINLVRPVPQIQDDNNISSVRSFNTAWDTELDSLLKGQYSFYGIRNAEYLNYKLQQPFKEYRIMVYQNNQGTIGGYIVFRKAVNKFKDIFLVKICDLAGTNQAKSVLVQQAMNYAISEKADGIISLSSASDQQFYSSNGFWLMKNFPVVLARTLPTGIHVSFFDSDLDDLW